MEEKRCKSCFHIKENTVCPHCGYPENPQNQAHHLAVGTMLRGRYQLGRVLGQGGFGITYMAWDNLMHKTVAVKEFFPNGTVFRRNTQSPAVECINPDMVPHYEYSKTRFLREASALVKFKDIPEVVDILDFVEENNTAYIVMEFVRGVDLAKYIHNKGGSLSVEETFRILRPVMEALAAVHKGGIVHRDISPDNIILDPLGGAKLLDFGAVRAVENPDVEKGLNKSTEAILKHGFAPLEQYNTRGSLGPWTDEYALCATIYYCLTGKVPEEASLRMSEGIDPDWSRIPGLPLFQQKALQKGLSNRAKDRYPDMDSLIRALFPENMQEHMENASKPGAVIVESPEQSKPLALPKAGKKEKRKAGVLLLILMAAAVAAISLGFLFLGPEAEEPRKDHDAALVQTEEEVPEKLPEELPEESTAQLPDTEDGLKLGYAIVADTSSSENGQARFDVTVAAVLVDEQGIIADCVIDSVSTTLAFDNGGEITSDLNAPILTKTELGEDYGLKRFGGAKYEWYEQAAALADYAVGKTVDQLKYGAVSESGYAADADLASTATIYLGSYVSAIEEAVNNAVYVGAQPGDELRLTIVSSLAGSYPSNGGEPGAARLVCDVTLLSVQDNDNYVCLIDSMQAEVFFNSAGELTTASSAAYHPED